MGMAALDLLLPFVYQNMADVTRLQERTEQAVRWLRKIQSQMRPRDWGEFIHWIVNDAENRSVFLQVHEDREDGPPIVRPLVGTDDPVHPQLAGVILYFPKAREDTAADKLRAGGRGPPPSNGGDT